MAECEKLIEYIKGLTPEQIDKVIERLPLIKQALGMTESQALYTQTFTGKLFGITGGNDQ